MNTRKPLILLSCLLCLQAAPWLMAQEEPAPPDANSTSASVILQINGYPNYRGPEQWINLFNTIAQAAARDLLQTPEVTPRPTPVPSMGRNYAMQFEPVSVSDREITGKLTVTIYNGDLPPIANEIRDETVARFQRFLQTDYETNQQVLNERIGPLQDLVEQSQSQLKELESQALEISGGKQIDPDQLRETITRLSQERDETAFHLRTLENRMQNLQSQRDRAGEEHARAAADDTILQQLQQKVDLLQHQLEQVKSQQQAGTMPVSDVTAAQQQLIDARIELAHRREALQTNPAAQKARELEEAITDLSMETSEQQMRIGFLEEQIAQARGRLEHATEYDTLRIKIDTRRDTLYDTMRQLEQIRSTLATLQPPRLTVLTQ